MSTEVRNWDVVAKEYLKSLVSRGRLSIKPQVKDRYGRWVAEVFSGLENLNLRMVEEGNAWAYRRYLKSCDSTAYLNAEAAAKQKGRGLWGGTNPIAPWEFRRAR